MLHTKLGGIYFAVWEGLLFGFAVSTAATLLFGEISELIFVDRNVSGGGWSFAVTVLFWLFIGPTLVWSPFIMKEWTPRKTLALAVVLTGGLVFLSITLGLDLSSTTGKPLVPLIVLAATRHFTWMIGATIAGTAFWIFALVVMEAAAAGWKKLAGG